MPKLKAPDLTRTAPRSPRVRLGGYVLLPRVLDKCRAALLKKNGEYNYNCPLDQYFLKFAGVDPVSLKKQVAKGLGDGEILALDRKEPEKFPEWSGDRGLVRLHEPTCTRIDRSTPAAQRVPKRRQRETGRHHHLV